MNIEKKVDSKFLLDSVGWLEHILLCGNQLGKFLFNKWCFGGISEQHMIKFLCFPLINI